MKIEEYDKIVNIVSKCFTAIVCLVIFVALSYGLFSGIRFLLNWSLDWSIPYWPIHIISAVIGLPLSFVIWVTANAEKGHDLNLRDFWAFFAESVKVDEHEHDKKEIKIWIDQNILNLHRRIGYTYDKNNNPIATYIFISKKDAVAFKLRWG